MRALCYYGKADVRVEDVPEPRILNPRDAIVKITATAICGSDLHIFGGYIPTMQKGDILGHEFMGEVVEVGKANQRLKVGDRVVVPFTIACGNCYFCKEEMWSLCDNSNPNAWLQEKVSGFAQTHMHKYMPLLLDRIERGEIDPSFVITHRMTLEDAPEMYKTFREKQDDCIKVVMKPGR